MDEEVDSVVAEIPVFLSQTLSKQLYLFQYPVRPLKNNADAGRVLNCKFKPLHQQVKLELELETDHDRYSTSKGEQIALNTDGSQSSFIVNKEKDKNAYFKSGYMDKIQYESTSPIVDASKYAIAILQDGEMHFTPLNGIIQLRPSYSYFDKQDRRTKEEEKDKSEIDEDAGPSKDGELKQVTVSFARTETDRSKKARESSFGYLARKSSEEPWCDSVWWNSTSGIAELERNKLLACPGTSGGLELAAADYLSLLVPLDEESATAAPGVVTAADVHNLNDLKRLSLIDQCKVLLKDAKVATLGWACEVLKADSTGVLGALSATCRLLNGGRWAVQSSLLYPTGSVSKHSGVPDHLMCRARDYVLYLFTQSQYVDRRKVTTAVKLPPDEVKEILLSVARMQTGKGWELIVPPDIDFENDHPDIQQRQTLFWEVRRREFNEMLSGETAIPKRQRKKSQRDSFSSDGGMPAPKVKGERVRRDSSVGSDSESGSDTVKLVNRNSPGCNKRTKIGATNGNFNSNDTGRVS